MKRLVIQVDESAYNVVLGMLQLCQHVEVLTPEWLKRNGSCFNRTRAEWTDTEGKKHQTSWVYPLHEIILMLQDGRIKELVCKK